MSNATSSFAFRYEQSINHTPTRYTLDLAAGLTQVLADEQNTYRYGLDRIAQVTGTDMDYYLPDALGSLRQLVSNSGDLTLAQSYAPFGSPFSPTGDQAPSYGFAGEWSDATRLQYLRARYYSIKGKPVDPGLLSQGYLTGTS